MTDLTRDEYDDLLKANCARFTETIGRYTARMPKADREDFISTAYEQGYEMSNQLAHAHSPLRWWEDVCRAAAKMRKYWTVITTTGLTKIRSNRLGR